MCGVSYFWPRSRAALIGRFKPTRKAVVFVVEVAGLAAICYGLSLWSTAAAWIVAGVGLVVEAYAVERR